MKENHGMKLGALLLLIAALLFFTGCTQPATAPAKTPSPPATTAAPTTSQPTAIPIAQATVNGTLVKAQLAVQSGEYAQDINKTALAAALAEGPNSTAFATVLNQLKELKSKDSRIIYLYTLEQKNGSVWFIVDANYGLPDGSNYMDEYTDAAPELFSSVTKPIGVGPYTDQWGTFYSGYAPVDIGGNRTVLIGVDFRA